MFFQEKLQGEHKRKYRFLILKKYSIPLAVGGRKNNDLLLREDEFMMGGRQILQKAAKKAQDKAYKSALNDLDNHFEIDNHKKKPKFLTIGYGKLNPNDPQAFKNKKRKFQNK